MVVVAMVCAECLFRLAYFAWSITCICLHATYFSDESFVSFYALIDVFLDSLSCNGWATRSKNTNISIVWFWLTSRASLK